MADVNQTVRKLTEKFRYWDIVALTLLYLVVAGGYVAQTLFSYYSAAWSEVAYALKARYHWPLLRPLALFIFFTLVMRITVPQKNRTSGWVIVIFLTLWFNFAPTEFLAIATVMFAYFITYTVAGLICHAYAESRTWPVIILLIGAGVLTFGYVAVSAGDGAAARVYDNARANGMFAENKRLHEITEWEKLSHAGIRDVRLATEYTIGGSSQRKQGKKAVDWQYIPVFSVEDKMKDVNFLLYCEGEDCKRLENNGKLEGFVSLLRIPAQLPQIAATTEEKEIQTITAELREHGLTYADSLVIITPGKLKNQSTARLMAEVKINLKRWSYFMAALLLLQVALTGKREKKRDSPSF